MPSRHAEKRPEKRGRFALWLATMAIAAALASCQREEEAIRRTPQPSGPSPISILRQCELQPGQPAAPAAFRGPFARSEYSPTDANRSDNAGDEISRSRSMGVSGILLSGYVRLYTIR
ncbi:MAG: hypothetical protein KIT09_17750 [Bryobacteraceae bacterium]|nr:hypothetical protein [Bryobacteraceae bacterium]